jgi:hypothetical protein
MALPLFLQVKNLLPIPTESLRRNGWKADRREHGWSKKGNNLSYDKGKGGGCQKNKQGPEKSRVKSRKKKAFGRPARGGY